MTRRIPALLGGGIALLMLAACGSATASTSSSGSPSPSGSQRGAFRGAAGQLVQINGQTLVVSASSGDTTVTYDSSTVFTQSHTGTVANIVPGDCIAAGGTKQAGGGIAIDTVRVNQPVNGSCSGGFGFGGRSPGSSVAPRSPRPSFSPPPQAANRANLRGRVASVTGTTVTVTQSNGTTQAITVPTTVAVSTINTVQSSALQTGQCVLATGSRNSLGTVTARSISIVPPGPNGCFSGGRGGVGGGFPGGGFPGGGGAGAGGATSTT